MSEHMKLDADAFRRGADAMREAAAAACQTMADARLHDDSGMIALEDCADTIRTMPMPEQTSTSPKIST